MRLLFNDDIKPLLTLEKAKKHQLKDAYELLFQKFLSKLSGKP